MAMSFREQTGFFQRFMEQTASGVQRVDGRFRQRAKQYIRAAKALFTETKRKVKQLTGTTEERRVLGNAEHCPECIEYAARGWVPVGTLPVPGEQSSCRQNCRCRMEWR